MTSTPNMEHAVDLADSAVENLRAFMVRASWMQHGPFGEATPTLDQTLSLLRLARQQVEGALTLAVLGARAVNDPPSWAVIGEMFGISRQAAQQRFGGEGPRGVAVVVEGPNLTKCAGGVCGQCVQCLDRQTENDRLCTTVMAVQN